MHEPVKPPAPIRSTREGEAGLHEALDRFVVGLGERIDRLQDAEQAGRLPELARAAAALGAEAAALGYAPLAGEAARLAAQGEAGDADAAHGRLVELTRVAERVRRGHRSAA